MPNGTTDGPTDGPTDELPPHEDVAPEGMAFLEHLEELRWRILKAMAATIIGAAVCFMFSDELLHLLTAPYEDAVQSLQEQGSPGPVEAIKRWLEEVRGHEVAETPVEEATRPAVPYNRQLQSLKVMTWFFVSLQVALLGGLILASPVVFFQFWRFVAPGLLTTEKRLFLPIVAMSVVCFSAGAAVAHSLVLPIGLRFFLSLEPKDMTSQWAVDEYMGFVLRLIFGFGIVFEMPVVSLFLARLGLVTADYLRGIRRYAVVVIFVLAAVFTPPDPLSQMMMAFPLLGLYEISIWIAAIAGRRRAREQEQREVDDDAEDTLAD